MPGDLLPVFLACLGTDTCLILSGEIGAGKTSVASHLAAELDEQRVAVGGILSPRIIEDGATIGYTIRDLMTDEERPFASLDPPGVPVGKFFIAEQGLAFARCAIEQATTSVQTVFVDEVGKLELAGNGLAPAVQALLQSQVLSILLVRSSFVEAVVHTFSITRFREFDVGQKDVLSCSERRVRDG